jgi:hypothetical protein
MSKKPLLGGYSKSCIKLMIPFTKKGELSSKAEHRRPNIMDFKKSYLNACTTALSKLFSPGMFS